MGLRETVKEQKSQNKPESNSEELMKLIQDLNSEISKLQSDKQEMLTILKEQDVKLKEQTRYVEESKNNELESKRLLNEANEAKALSDRANQQAQQALRQAQNEAERAKQAQEQARIDSQERYNAQQKAKEIERATERSKMTYKSLFIGQMIFTMALAFFVAYSKRGTLLEMVKWFPARWNNIKSFASWIAMRYMAAIHLIQGKWEVGNWAFLIVTVISLGLLVGLFFIVRYLIIKIKDFLQDVRRNCLDTTFKDIVSGDIALISLYIVLFFADPIKRVIPLNILSLWLILSFIGIVGWHMTELIETIKEKA